MTISDYTRRQIVALAMVSISSVSFAQAPCGQWSLETLREIVQGNGIVVHAGVRLTGDVVDGSAAYDEVKNVGGERFGTGWAGGIAGTMVGNHFNVEIQWANGSTGVYSGQVAPDGRLSGTTYDRRKPNVRVSWHSPSPLTCVDQTDRPVRSLGKKPIPSAGNPAPPPSAQDAAKVTMPVVRSAQLCAIGFVWRTARPIDSVCVPPVARDRVLDENRRAQERRDSAGAYGPNSCKAGYVWREAFPGDQVCVIPVSREQALDENRLAQGRMAR